MTETSTVQKPQAPAMPKVKGGVTPYLCLDGAARAAEFYARAFGAETAFAYPPDAKGRTMHVHLYINGSSVMLSDAYPEHGCPWQQPQGFNLMLRVDDIDAWWDRAIAAGCTPVDAAPGDVLGRSLRSVSRSIRCSLGVGPGKILRSHT
jgi:uncharacterized glyoxalase superfamily protein PhnB